MNAIDFSKDIPIVLDKRCKKATIGLWYVIATREKI